MYGRSPNPDLADPRLSDLLAAISPRLRVCILRRLLEETLGNAFADAYAVQQCSARVGDASDDVMRFISSYSSPDHISQRCQRSSQDGITSMVTFYLAREVNKTVPQHYDPVAHSGRKDVSYWVPSKHRGSIFSMSRTESLQDGPLATTTSNPYSCRPSSVPLMAMGHPRSIE